MSVSAPGCCCCMPLQHNRLMDLCSYVREVHYYLQERGAFAPPLPPLNPPLVLMQCNPPEWNWCKHCILKLIYINFVEIQVGSVAKLKVSMKTSHVDCTAVELQQHITIMSHF